MTKVFQIGFNKCGTSTIGEYFSENGYNSIHWDRGLLARRIFYNLSDGADIISGYEHYDVFTDMIYQSHDILLEAYKLFPFIAEQYKDAVFILNTRDREAWIHSRLRHRQGAFATSQKKFWKVNSNDQLIEIWRSQWDAHHRRVARFFESRQHRFFVFNIDSDKPQVINENIPEFQLDPARYGIHNKTRPRPLTSRWRRAAARNVTRLLQRS